MNTQTNTPSKRAILYLRFSDPKQIGGSSIEVQEKIARVSCEAEGYEVVDVIKDEAVSADGNKSKTTQRVAHLLEFCRERKGDFEVLVVYKLDRFARSQREHHWLRAELLKSGILLRSATEKIDESPAGKLVEGMLAAVNEYENEVRRERSRLGLWKRVDQGLWPWPAPTGYMKDPNKPEGVRLVPHLVDENCHQTVVHLFTRYSTGVVSKNALRKELIARKVKNHRGKVLTFPGQTINNILDNIYYTGHLKNMEGKIVKGQHEPLISLQLFQECQDVLKGRSNNTNKTRNRYNPEFVLRKFAKCGYCHQPLTAANCKSEHSGKYAYYWCYNKDCLKSRKSIKKAVIENDFSAYLSKIKPTDEFLERFDRVFLKRYKERETEVKGDYIRQLDYVKQCEKDKQWVIQQGREKIFKGDTFREELEKVEQKLSLAKLELAEMHDEELDIDALLAYAYDFIRTVENTWYDAPFPLKLRLQQLIFPKGVEYKDGEFSNPKISPLFKLIEVFGAKDVNLVTPRGIEPLFLP